MLYLLCAHTLLARRRSRAAARPSPLLLAIHGYTQQQYQVLLILYLTYTTYNYYTTAAVFAVCTYIARPPSLARRRLPAAAFVGYTRIYTAAVSGSINTVPYLVAVCINTIRSALRCTYDIPLPVCITFLLARRRLPAAALVGCTQHYTAVHFCWYVIQ